MSKDAHREGFEPMNALGYLEEAAAAPPQEAAARPEAGRRGQIQARNLGLIEARDRFFPGWWVYAPGGGLSDQPRTLYRVVCSTDEDRRAAEEAKPDFIDAVILLRDKRRPVREAALRRFE